MKSTSNNLSINGIRVPTPSTLSIGQMPATLGWPSGSVLILASPYWSSCHKCPSSWAKTVGDRMTWSIAIRALPDPGILVRPSGHPRLIFEPLRPWPGGMLPRIGRVRSLQVGSLASSLIIIPTGIRFHYLQQIGHGQCRDRIWYLCQQRISRKLLQMIRQPSPPRNRHLRRVKIDQDLFRNERSLAVHFLRQGHEPQGEVADIPDGWLLVRGELEGFQCCFSMRHLLSIVSCVARPSLPKSNQKLFQGHLRS